jgi:hypothetical protein
MKMVLKKVHRAMTYASIDLIGALRFLRRYPGFLNERNAFLKMAGKKFGSSWHFSQWPILLDRDADSASLGEYFWQDLFVAKRIINENPTRHVDVGSRVDGFIAHLACVRPVEVFDIRPLSAKIENVSFKQWDITNPDQELIGDADCVSCLHTLEHIGLGRYGDPIDPDGWKKGLSSLAGLVKLGGAMAFGSYRHAAC